MKNQESWQPSKFVFKRGKLVGSRDAREVGVGSRLITDLIAGFYDRGLREYARGKLLDLGCGSVPLYGAYRDHVTDIVCADWANTAHKTNHLDVECDLSLDLPFGDAEFDTILLSDVLEHVPEPKHLWGEMSRILRPGGRILMNVPFYYWLHETPYDYYRYTEFALRRFVENEGLALLLLEPIGGAPEVLADFLAKTVGRTRFVGRGIAVGIQGITGRFVRTSVGKKASRKSSRTFPLGYFLIAEKAS